MTHTDRQRLRVRLCKTPSPTRWRVEVEGHQIGQLDQTSWDFPRHGAARLSFSFSYDGSEHRFDEATLRRAREAIAEILWPSQPAPAAGPLLTALEQSLGL